MKISDLTIGLYLHEGVEVLDFAGPLEVFTRAGFKVVILSKNDGPITSQDILKVIPDHTIDNAPSLDIVAFFGGHGVQASQDTVVLNWLKGLTNIQYYFTVCTGAFYLARVGLLDGLTATTYHTEIEELKKVAPKTKVLSDARWVDNGNVITTAGVSAGIDGALHFVSKLAGLEAARSVAEFMEYDTWNPDAGVDTNRSQ